jgi:multidrug efflux pump
MFARIPLTLFFMIKLLMTELQSFSRLFLVLSVVQMRLIGNIAALLTFNRPLDFVAFSGVMALLGLIARHAVILVEQIQTERQERSGAWESVVEPRVSRFRPLRRSYRLSWRAWLVGMAKKGWRRRLNVIPIQRLMPRSPA